MFGESQIRKVIRYSGIYGPIRAVYKVLGRTRRRVPVVLRRHKDADIAMVGCGQYAFSTIGYYITRKFGGRFRWCYDVNSAPAESFGWSFRVKGRAETPDDWLRDVKIRIVYIASNHQSHTPYAVDALRSGKNVYIEKPVSVTLKQLAELELARRQSGRDIYAGYNRPHSGAIRYLRSLMAIRPDEGISMNCFVAGHKIPMGHWYRDPDEGTRICGNAGHWIDLFVHLSGWRGHATSYRISLISACPDDPDDNFSLSIASDRGDILSLMLSARTDPFEGVTEAINIQHGEATCQIDDFRRATYRIGSDVFRRRFWPKDVGHRGAILQPLIGGNAREWGEVIQSTLLILRITRMIHDRQANCTVNMSEEHDALECMIAEL